MTEQISMIELFSGIGAQERSLRQLKLPYEITHTCDCDPNAVLSYAAMRWDLEKEMETFEFPSQDKMIEELQAKNLGYNFQNGKHSIIKRTPINKLKQCYIADYLSRNLGDISKVDSLPYVDIICHSSPCQSFSCAGKGEGGDEGSGTTSSLMWESLRLIGTSMPQFIVWENVAAVLSGKHRHNFIKYLERLSEMGYESAFELLNSKNYGVPQNRLRIFCVSRKIENEESRSTTIRECNSSNKQVLSTMKEIRGKHPNIKIWEDFTFPEPIPLTTRLKDILEINVDDKYYLPDERIEKLLNLSKNINTEPFVVASRGRNPENPSDRTTGAPTEQRFEPNFSGTTNCLTSVAKDNYICEPVLIEDFYKSREARIYSETAPTLRSERIGLEVAEEFPCSTRGKQVASAIRASIYKQGVRNIEENIINGLGYEGVVEKEQPITRWRIRKLTPVECWRLMGFTDEDYNRAAQYVSASARYKQAGNSIVVNTLVSLFSSLLVDNGYKSEIWTKYITDFTDKSH